MKRQLTIERTSGALYAVDVEQPLVPHIVEIDRRASFDVLATEGIGKAQRVRGLHRHLGSRRRSAQALPIAIKRIHESKEPGQRDAISLNAQRRVQEQPGCIGKPVAAIKSKWAG